MAGYYGRWIDNLLMRVTDLFLAIPFLVILIIGSRLPETQGWARAIMGDPKSLRAVVVILSAFFWMPVARVIRGLVLSSEGEGVHRGGAGGGRVRLAHHVPPPPAQLHRPDHRQHDARRRRRDPRPSRRCRSSGSVSTRSPRPRGATSSRPGQGQIDIAPHLVWIPGLAITLVVLCVNFIGDGLRDALDPKQLAV